MPYIKSHSNYVLKSKHQGINDGTIFERDITTIGGLNQFSKGQTPIYKSGNFIITVRNDNKTSNQYNTSKWKENESGETWTLQTVSGMVSDYEDQDDTKIVLKQDYYDFRDFAYYGSLTELFRASVTDIVARFPGELYVTSSNTVCYTSGETIDFEGLEGSVPFSSVTNGNLVSNPFGIDIFSKIKPSDADPLKYFADSGYTNYEIIIGESKSGTPISSCNVDYEDPCYNEKTKVSAYTVGSQIATVTLDGVNIEVWLGDNHEPIYFSNNVGVHIRPNEKFLSKFYNECDSFQKLLLNKDTNYKATFSVIRENDYGYYREFVPFQFPIGEGKYNIDATNYGFNAYTKQMVEIGEFYDERFTDNLWRSMTHEAIKNFDWTYTREYEQGDEEEYVIGGQRIQKALRVFAREFDEIISYINNIKNLYRVTYDGRSNLPDYFLTDTLENDGWKVKLVYPFTLKEYYYDESGKTYISNSGWTEGGDCNGQLDNSESGHTIWREFSQNTTSGVTPYSKEMLDEEIRNGYFIVCKKGDGCISSDDFTLCNYSGDTYGFVSATVSSSTLYDKCALGGEGVIKNRIKSYTDEKVWTSQEVNNEFLRRLKINSRYIWRNKGTVEGLEMILGMFGMKSRRWVEAHPQEVQACRYSSDSWDFDVTEYTSFAERIEEPWDAVHQNYRMAWLNSTKTIVYDNRFISNYNTYGANTNVTEYEGIPVAYRDEYSAATEPYIKIGRLGEQEPTSATSSAFCRADGTAVRRRYLYPSFNKNEQLDGNPYYQMNGGWLRKTIKNGEKTWNFQFDVDDAIVYTRYISAGTTDTDGTIVDNKALYKETVRNIRRVDNVNELLSIPTNNLYNGVICNVTRVERNSAVIDGVVYPIDEEYVNSGTIAYEVNSGNTAYSISFTKSNGFVKVGKNKFFDTTMYVSDINGAQYTYDIEGMEEGLQVKAYIIGDTFICQEDSSGNYSISSFQMLNGTNSESGETSYFVLDDINYADELARYDESISGWTSGWRRLYYGDSEYLKVNTILNEYEGNNPHNGNMIYDSGHEYFTYFKRLFKHAADNDLFAERCYEDYYRTLDDEINNYGFSGLINDNESILQYDNFITGDSKIHYFGNYKKKKGIDGQKDEWKVEIAKSEGIANIDKVLIYGDNTERITGITREDGTVICGFNGIYSGETTNISGYNLSASTEDGWIEEVNPYNPQNGLTSHASVIDEVTNQIVNNKRVKITFNLHNKWYTNEGQCELKYIDNVVMNYLTQMIPSSAIVDIEYISKEDENQ